MTFQLASTCSETSEQCAKYVQSQKGHQNDVNDVALVFLFFNLEQISQIVLVFQSLSLNK